MEGFTKQILAHCSRCKRVQVLDKVEDYSTARKVLGNYGWKRLRGGKLLCRNCLELGRLPFDASQKQPVAQHTPMTTAEALDRYECSVCRGGGDCGWNCVESNTGSIRCSPCGSRVWFARSLPPRGLEYTCPYCEVKGRV